MKKVKKDEIKLDKISHAITQIIDHLSYEYYMRITLVSTVKSRWADDLACKIMKLSNSTVNFKYIDTKNKSQLIDFDESYIVFHEEPPASIFSERMKETKYATYRRTMVLLFNPHFVGVDDKIMKKFEIRFKKPTDLKGLMLPSFIPPKEPSHPHDIYQLSHDIQNGSMWLMSNEMFFNGSCDPYYHPINFFDSKELKWNSLKFFNSYKNFNNCEILVESNLDDDVNYLKTEAIKKKIRFLNLALEAFASKHQIEMIDDNSREDNLENGKISRISKSRNYKLVMNSEDVIETAKTWYDSLL